MEQLEFSDTVCRGGNGIITLGNWLQFSIRLNLHLPYDGTNLLPGVVSTEMHLHISPKDIHKVFLANHT